MAAPAVGGVVARRADAESLVGEYRHTGDRQALARIMEAYRGLLGHLVGRHAAVSEESYEDLMQVAHVGLIKAIKNYDPEGGAAFGTYAYAVVEGEIRHHLRDTGLVRRPRWARSLYAKVVSESARLEGELGRQPEIEEVADHVNVSPDGIVELMKLYGDTSVVSLDGAEEEGVDLSAIKSVRQESFSLPIEDRIALEQAIESLTEIQRKVVYLFFYKDLTQTEIGKRLGFSQRKVSRVVASSLKAMKAS